MRYVISDIHGCYEQYIALLEKIHFSEEDTLYVLGDVVDRGPEPMKVLLDMMNRPNVNFIIGNHDFSMFCVMKLVLKWVCDGNLLNDDETIAYKLWLEDGGLPTEEAFLSLTTDERQDVLNYIKNAFVYEEIWHDDKRYVLAHAGIRNYSSDKDLDEYDVWDFVDGRTDYSKHCFEDENTTLITGHTPTFWIRSDRKPLVYVGNGHICVDCGCAYGGRLAAYCIETGEATYIDGL